MRVNVYAEEISQDIEIVKKTTADGTFMGLRMYLYLPVTLDKDGHSARGKFMHHPGDDDSAAITFWGKQDLLKLLERAVAMLDTYYDQHGTS